MPAIVGAVVADELQPLYPSFRQQLLQHLAHMGFRDLAQGTKEVDDYFENRSGVQRRYQVSQDGLFCTGHRDAYFAIICATLSLAAPKAFDTGWMSSLPHSASSTLYCPIIMIGADQRTRVLVAECFERLGQYKQAVEWAQVTALVLTFGFCAPFTLLTPHTETHTKHHSTG